MEIFELLLKYIHELKWPLVIIFIVIYYKGSIVSLLGKLAEVNIGGDKGFNLKLRAAKKIAEEKAVQGESSSAMPQESNMILSMPDEEFLYLNSISKKPIKNTYFPASNSELRYMHELCESGIMRQKSMSEFELTDIGKTLVGSLGGL